MNTVMKLRLYPNQDQQIKLHATFGAVRWVYNNALDIKQTLYKRSNENVDAYTLINRLPGLKKLYPWLKDIPSQTIQASIKNMDTAYVNFFKHGRGYPKFKSKHASRQSFQLPQGVKINPEMGKVYLPKIGWVKARGWRKLQGKIKTSTVSYTTDGSYHVSIMFQHPSLAVPVTNNGKTIGLDLGVKIFAYLSDGTRFELPVSLKKKHTKLKKLHKAVSRKKLTSNNRAKAKKKLAKKYRQIANTRKDFAHKVSNQLSENQAVVIEDLNTKQMTEARGASKKDLNREILNQGWHQFIVFLEYKLARKGNHLNKVDPAYTSQTCSRCGCVDKASRLSQSRFVCTSCGYKIHADLNAAVNILNRGKHGDSLPLNTGYGMLAGSLTGVRSLDTMDFSP